MSIISVTAVHASLCSPLYIVQNHAFDNMLGWLSRNNSDIDGLTGAEYNLLDPADPTSPKSFVTDRGAYRDPDPDHSVEGTAHGIYGKTSGIAEHDPAAVTMGGFAAAYQKVRGGQRSKY